MIGPKGGDGGLALRHASALLDALGMQGRPEPLGDHPALAWRRAGLMAITGSPEGPPLVAPVALTAAADGALAALRAIAPDLRLSANGAALLGERARLLGFTRQGSVSANGSCRLVAARDGRFALNLARIDDWDLMPALFGEDAADWSAVAEVAARQCRDDLVARGRLLGLAIAPDETPPVPAAPFTITRIAQARRRTGMPLVVDLSPLWAGPLAGSLLAAAGAQVVKVESPRRPDGARGGDPSFFNLMNAGKLSVALDFADPGALRDLIAAADIVIEGSRPRALQQMGVAAEEMARRGATWVSITAHGREGEAAGHIGFGDDAAVAGGLAAAMARGWHEPLFAGDAIADPLAGLTAAFAAWAGWLSGGGVVVSVPLSRVVANACALHEAGPEELQHWQAMAQTDTAPLYPMRAPASAAPALGADNARLPLPSSR
jgi:crotonobetainyl-CoA:carnitine CoA-transferase CaiB-like acyl-CoA transferase